MAMADAPARLRFVHVLLHDPARPAPVSVGHLSRYGDIHRLSFDPAYIADADRATLSLRFRGADEAATQDILTAPRDERLVTLGHLPAWFENLLPEGHNRTRLARQRGCDEDDEFELLAAAGHDLMGALEVVPVGDGELPGPVRAWHVSLGLEAVEPGFVEEPVADGASLPGVVTKFSAVQQGRRYVVHHRGGAGDVILKLPSLEHPDLVENEAACYRLAAAVGIDGARAEVVSAADVDLPDDLPFATCLAVHRFDRDQGRRVHMEEFAQVLGLRPAQKYGGRDAMGYYARMLRVLDRLSARPVADTAEMLRRFVAFILMGNVDAHLKNWALRYADGRTPTLAPAYDLVCVAAFLDPARPARYGVNRAVDARLRALTLDDLEDGLIRAAGLRNINALRRVMRDTIGTARAAWPALLAEAPPSMAAAVTQRLGGGTALAG